MQQIEKGKDKEKRVDATINYIFQKPSGSWTAPQKLASDIKVDPVNEAKKLYWKKVAAFYLKEQDGKERRIVIVIGETKFDSVSPSNLFTLDEDLVASENQRGKFINNLTYDFCAVNFNKELPPLQFLSKVAVGNKIMLCGNKSSQINIYDNESETWSTHTASEARGEEIGIAVVNNKVIFFGGSKQSGSGGSSLEVSSKIDIYDNKTGRWTTNTTSEARYRLATAVVGKKAIFFGGSNPQENRYSAQVDIYNDETGNWTTHTASEGRFSAKVAVVGKRAIFSGGVKTGGYSSSQVDIYDDETGNWTTHTTSGRGYEAVAVVGKKAIFFGGWESSRVDIYDDKAKRWTTYTASEARYHAAVAVVGRKAIFFGGSKPGGPSSQVDIYDEERDTWTTRTMSEARYDPAVAVVGRKAIFFGGSSGGSSSQIDIYDDETGRWTTHTTSEARNSIAVVVINRKAIFFAGWNSQKSKYSSQIDIYDDESNTWTVMNMDVPIKSENITQYSIIHGNSATFIGTDDNYNALKYEILGDKILSSSYDVINNSDKLLLGETKNIFETNVTNKEGNAKLLYENNSTKWLTLLGNFKKSGNVQKSVSNRKKSNKLI